MSLNNIRFPYYFDFKDYEMCFKMLRHYRAECTESIVLVICTSPYASGYWIELERLSLNDKDCFVYKTAAELEGLYNRIVENEKLKLLGKVNGGLIV